MKRPALNSLICQTLGEPGPVGTFLGRAEDDELDELQWEMTLRLCSIDSPIIERARAVIYEEFSYREMGLV